MVMVMVALGDGTTWEKDSVEQIHLCYLWTAYFYLTMVGSLDGKESSCNAGDSGSIPESKTSPGEENSYPLQNSCLENSMDNGAWWATVHGVAKSWTKLGD